MLCPSLNALRAFEAAARLGSLTAAAAELGVSHGAVSHHIGAMESFFGVALVQRLARSVRPTEEGAQLAAKLTQGFNLINLGVSLLQPSPLKLSCSSTIMMHWLIPRLGSFKEQYPNIEVRLNVNYGVVDFVRDEISVAIRIDRIGPPPEAIVLPLIHEEIGPVCSSGYAERHAIAEPAALSGMRLLGTATRPKAWTDWLASVGESEQTLEPCEVYEHFYLQNQAAACGLGVGVSPRILVYDQIVSGRLVAPLGFTPGPYRLVLWVASYLSGRADTRALVAWLKDGLAAMGRGESKGVKLTA